MSRNPPTQFKKAPPEQSGGAFVFWLRSAYESRIAIAPPVSKITAAIRYQVAASRSTNTEIRVANRIEVSRKAATAATGAKVIAHKAMP